MYCAVIGDIISSKTLPDRSFIQNNLKIVLAKANKTFDEEIASLFAVTLGDELQGILKRAARVFDIIEFIQRKMHPVRLRFGIGLDEIYTEIDPEMPIGADGPAFHKARDMINDVRKKQNSLLSYQPEIFFRSRQCDDELINAAAVLYRQLERSWTDKQRRYIDYFFDVSENQYVIAKHFGVTQPAVNKAFERSGLYKYKYALDCLRGYFEKNNF